MGPEGRAPDALAQTHTGLVAARAPELEPELLGAMRQWSAGRLDLNTAQVCAFAAWGVQMRVMC